MNQETINEIRRESCLFDSTDPECSEKNAEHCISQILKDLINPPVIEIIKY